MDYVSKKIRNPEKSYFKFEKSLLKAIDMNMKIPDVYIRKEKLNYMGISPYKWIIIFVGPTNYEIDILLKNYI